MISELIARKICYKLSVDAQLPLQLSNKPVLTYTKLVQALIEVTTVNEAASILSVKESDLVQFIKKYLRPLAHNKGARTRWCTYLLGLVDLKLCSYCNEIYGIEDFSVRNTGEKCSVCTECNRERNKVYTSVVSGSVAYRNKHRYKTAIRRARKIRATPSWSNLSDIREIYRLCPEGYHVDHIIPLKGYLVSGLHVPSNLQYLTVEENLNKGNKFVVT